MKQKWSLRGIILAESPYLLATTDQDSAVSFLASSGNNDEVLLCEIDGIRFLYQFFYQETLLKLSSLGTFEPACIWLRSWRLWLLCKQLLWWEHFLTNTKVESDSWKGNETRLVTGWFARSSKWVRVRLVEAWYAMMFSQLNIVWLVDNLLFFVSSSTFDS